MKAKYKELQFVEVDGHATGYGDLVGWVMSVEMSEILGEPYYQVRVHSDHIVSVTAAEKFVSEVSPPLSAHAAMGVPAKPGTLP